MVGMEKETVETVGSILQRIFKIQKQAREIEGCPGCQEGRVEVQIEGPDGEPQSAWWPCPSMSKTCDYGKGLYSRYVEHLKTLILHAGIPKVHIKNFGAPRETTAWTVADTWTMKGFLVFTGGTATGKSFAAAWTVRRFVPRCFEPDAWRNPSRWGEGAAKVRSSIAWIHAYDLIDSQAEKEKAKRVPFVVIDDLGTEDATAKAKSLVNYIVSHRYDEQLPTVITTNLSTSDITTRYGERLLDRIMHFGQVVMCDDCDLRSGGGRDE
jgi:hypothetical protein